MSAVFQVARKTETTTTDQVLHRLLSLAARELGLSKKQSEEAAEIGVMRVDGVKISISCMETDMQRDAVVVAKLSVPVDPASLRQLLEINLIAAITLGSTITIDCDGAAILLGLVPIATAGPASFANHISQMALFANTLALQFAPCR